MIIIAPGTPVISVVETGSGCSGEVVGVGVRFGDGAGDAGVEAYPPVILKLIVSL